MTKGVGVGVGKNVPTPTQTPCFKFLKFSDSIKMHFKSSQSQFCLNNCMYVYYTNNDIN